MDSSDYEVIGEAGKGSFGTIQIVRRKGDDDKEYVIKKQSINAYNFAINEVAIMSKLCHPNIVEFYNSWEENDQSYILMEYVRGSTLYELIVEARKDDRPPMTETEALDFFAQIALAVDHMHKRDVMHRDLKAENVLLASPDNKVKILDFGISSDASSELQVSVVNPNDYTAPENFSEELPHTFKSDVWSMGCLLYEAFTGVQPGNLTDDLDVLDDLTDEVGSILRKVLIMSPDERPDTSEILRYPELLPALRSYYETLEPTEREIVEEQMRNVINAYEPDVEETTDQ